MGMLLSMLVGLLGGFNIGAAHYRAKDLSGDVSKALDTLEDLSKEQKSQIKEAIQKATSKGSPLESFLRKKS